VIESVPTGSVEVVRVASPALNVPVPRTVVPSMNVTVSPLVGSPALEVTFAVNITDCPALDGFSEEVSVVVVGVRMKPWAIELESR